MRSSYLKAVASPRERGGGGEMGGGDEVHLLVNISVTKIS